MIQIDLAPNGMFRLHTSASTHVDIPCDWRAVDTIRRLLVARQMTAKPRIGTTAFPTQSQIEVQYRSLQQQRLDESLRDMDLAGLEFDI